VYCEREPVLDVRDSIPGQKGEATRLADFGLQLEVGIVGVDKRWDNMGLTLRVILEFLNSDDHTV